MTDIVLKYNMLDENARKQLNDFIDFLLSKNKEKETDISEYYNRIQTVSQWSDEDVAYLHEIENKFNWKVEAW
jgi:predicted house-cleaning noncanonical NTP pyrophosphatase (MazG superfamily)